MNGREDKFVRQYSWATIVSTSLWPNECCFHVVHIQMSNAIKGPSDIDYVTPHCMYIIYACVITVGTHLGSYMWCCMWCRAECVMLNKGPHIVLAVKTLDDILRRMRSHQMKKQSMMRPLKLANPMVSIQSWSSIDHVFDTIDPLSC